MDITNFMTWFVQQVARIFTYTFSTLNNITFAGTSLLKVIIFINIIVPFIYVIVTVPQSGAGAVNEYNENVRNRNEKARKKADKSWERRK